MNLFYFAQTSRSTELRSMVTPAGARGSVRDRSNYSICSGSNYYQLDSRNWRLEPIAETLSGIIKACKWLDKECSVLRFFTFLKSL